MSRVPIRRGSVSAGPGVDDGELMSPFLALQPRVAVMALLIAHADLSMQTSAQCASHLVTLIRI